MNCRCFSLNHRWLMIMTTKDEHLTWGKFSRAHASARPFKKYCMLWRIFLVLNRRAPTRVRYAKLTNGAFSWEQTPHLLQKKITFYCSGTLTLKCVKVFLHSPSIRVFLHSPSIRLASRSSMYLGIKMGFEPDCYTSSPPPQLSIKFNISNVKSSILNQIILVQ